MGIIERINSVLEYKIEFNFGKGTNSEKITNSAKTIDADKTINPDKTTNGDNTIKLNKTINLDKRINRNKTLAMIAFIIILLNAAGVYIGKEWFWVEHKSFYENKMGNLNQALKEHPGSKDVQAEIALTSYLNGDTDKAIKELRDVLRKDPKNSIAQFCLGVILCEKKETKESIALLSNYVKKNHGLETRIAYLCLGQNYLAAGNYDLALKSLNTASERDPGNPAVYYYLGQTYEKLKKTKRAIKAYEKALEINSGYVEAESALASLLKKAHKK